MFNILWTFVKYEIYHRKNYNVFNVWKLLRSHNSLLSYKYTFRSAYFITSYNNQVKIQFHKIEELISKECKMWSFNWTLNGYN